MALDGLEDDGGVRVAMCNPSRGEGLQRCAAWPTPAAAWPTALMVRTAGVEPARGMPEGF